MRFFFVDFLLPLLFFLLLRSFLRALIPPRRRPGRDQDSAVQLAPPSELVRDPVCGTYVSAAVSVKRTVQGQVFHFCSNECRDRYQG
jgi:YHS domain-containing protein